MGARKSGRTRKVAREEYSFVCCAICGLRQDGAIDTAHLDQNPSNDEPGNLAFLCKTHHRMFDMGLYPVQAIILLRDHWQKTMGEPDHSIYMKDAGKKAARTRRRSAGAKKAAATRRARASKT